uniref:Uncharacterized protein n=1 Tax=Aegilops tauschii TaxID=37682 RepID=M8CAM6_AEGTA
MPSYYVPSDALPLAEASGSTVAAIAVGAGEHTLTVLGYSRLKTMNGGYLESSAFKAGGHAWKICCHLNGSVKENAGFVSVFLKLVGAEATDTTAEAADAVVDKENIVHAELELALVHHRSTLIKRPSHSLGRREGPSAFRENVSMGYSRFVSAEDLKRSSFLKDDCFAVRCKVTVVQKCAVKGDVRPRGKALARFFSCIRG